MWEQAKAETSLTEDERRLKRATAYAEDVYRYAFARLGSIEDAEDVTMEVVQAALADSRLAKNRLLMLRNGRNRVIDRWRKRKPVIGLDEDVRESSSDADIELVVTINSVLAQLDEDHADFLILKYVHGLSAREIGRLTGKSRAAVNSALQRAREEFRRIAPELRPGNGE